MAGPLAHILSGIIAAALQTLLTSIPVGLADLGLEALNPLAGDREARQGGVV
jgi:hypothetical protein